MPVLVNGRLHMRPSEYAEHRGVTANRISMAIKRGKVFKNRDGLIDVEQADAMYTPDPVGQRGTPTEKRLQKTPPVFVAPGVGVAPPEVGHLSTPGATTPQQLETPIGEQSLDEMELSHADVMAQLTGQDIPSGAKPLGAEAILVKSKAYSAAMKAEMDRIELDKVRSNLISLEEVRETVAKIARHNRDGWMAWPDDVAVHLAATLKVDPKTLRDVLHDAVRRHLEDVANLNFDDITDPD